jgi:hypothetical protein
VGAQVPALGQAARWRAATGVQRSDRPAHGGLPLAQYDLVIELDTEQTHGTAWKRRDDAARDAWLEAQGIEVWRIRAYGPALADRLRQRLS